MSTTRWQMVFLGLFLLASCALFGLRPRSDGREPQGSRLLWEGADTAQVVAFSPDGTKLAIGTGVFNGSDGVAAVDLATGDQMASFSGHKNHIVALAFSADGSTLTSASYESVRRWDLSGGKEQGMASTAAIAYNSTLTLSPDGRFLALGQETAETGFQVVPLTDGAVRLLMTMSPRGPSCLAVSPDSLSLAAGFPCAVHIWDNDRRQPRSSLPFTNQPLTALGFSPDARTLATAYAEGDEWVIKLWDVATGTGRVSGRGHGGWINCLAFSPDGRTLVAGGLDTTIRLWDVAGSTERAVLRGHTDRVNAVAIAPDGRTLASASSDHTVRLWEVNAAE